MDRVRKDALINAFTIALYVIAVALFMNWGSSIKIGRVNTFLAPIALLLLFVTSAAICGYLVFGKPAQLYIDGKKKEALSLITQTLASLVVFTITALILLVILTR